MMILGNDCYALKDGKMKMPEGLSINRVMAYPLLLRWDGMKWDRRSGMNNQPMKTLEARIPRLKPVGVSSTSV